MTFVLIKLITENKKYFWNMRQAWLTRLRKIQVSFKFPWLSSRTKQTWKSWTSKRSQ